MINVPIGKLGFMKHGAKGNLEHSLVNCLFK